MLHEMLHCGVLDQNAARILFLAGQSLFMLRHGKVFPFHHVDGGWHKLTKVCTDVQVVFVEKLSALTI